MDQQVLFYSFTYSLYYVCMCVLPGDYRAIYRLLGSDGLTVVGGSVILSMVTEGNNVCPVNKKLSG